MLRAATMIYILLLSILICVSTLTLSIFLQLLQDKFVNLQYIYRALKFIVFFPFLSSPLLHLFPITYSHSFPHRLLPSQSIRQTISFVLLPFSCRLSLPWWQSSVHGPDKRVLGDYIYLQGTHGYLWGHSCISGHINSKETTKGRWSVWMCKFASMSVNPYLYKSFVLLISFALSVMLWEKRG